MRVKDIMDTDFPLLTPEQTCLTALQLLVKWGVTAAPVVDSDRLAGIFQLNSQMVIQLMETEHENKQLLVKDLMKVDVPVVWEEQGIGDIVLTNSPMIPVVGPGKHLVGIIWVSKITENMRLGIAQQLSWLNQVVESVHNGILAINEKGRIVLCNATARNMFGLGKEANGTFFADIFHETSLLDVLCSGEPALGQSAEFNGQQIISNRTPVKYGDRVIGAVSVFQDTTEIEEVSRRLASVQAINDELNAIFQSSHDGILIADGKGIILRVNRAVERLLGCTAQELDGKSVQELVDLGIINRSVTHEVLRTQKPVTIKQRTANGKETIATGSPIYDQEGRIFRVVTNIRDITELVELQLALESTRAQAIEVTSDREIMRSQKMQENGIIAASPAMLTVVDLALRVAQVDATVLVLGESGVGKEVIAKLIHRTSERNNTGQFISVNCGAIPTHLLESEFFGYEGGAFTGSKKEGKLGYFELAHQGTLFLDEIGELPIDVQVKLLRVIQEREVMKLGDTKLRKIDIRIIAATNRDLKQMVEEGSFREDLYYRLNVLPITVPPLRSRPEDIPVLLTSFLEKYCRKYGGGKVFSGGSLHLLGQYNWPGNVRELENVVERLVLTTDEPIILPQHLPMQLFQEEQPAVDIDDAEEFILDTDQAVEETDEDIQESDGEIKTLQEVMDEVEKEMIIKALQLYGSTRRAARILGVSQSTIARKAKKYQQKRVWLDYIED